MHFSIIALGAALAALAAGAPTAPATHVLHEKREAPARKWERRSLVDRSIKMPVRIGMTQRNLEIGDDLLMEV